MASASQPGFPSRPYSSTFHGKLPERSAPAFGATSSRETARLERERIERVQREGHAQASSSNPINTLTDDQRDEINEAFALFDLDKDQKIDYHEFKVALKALGFDLPRPDLMSLLAAHGHDPSPPNPSNRAAAPTRPQHLLLNLQAFQSIAARLIAERDPRDEILRAFALFDTGGKGIISLDDLRRVARELGEGLDDDELKAMIEEFDLEGRGGVDQEEFIRICMG